MNMIKGKKADIELSLNQIIGIVLAMMALIVIFTLISSLYNIFTDTEKERGVENGFYEIVSFIQSAKAGDNKTVPVMLTDDYAIVGFNRAQGAVEGECAPPSSPKDLDFSITRELVKCPKDSSCICMCKATNIDAILASWRFTRHELVECQNAICAAFYDQKDVMQPTFGKSKNCAFTLIYGEKVSNVEVAKTGSLITLNTIAS